MGHGRLSATAAWPRDLGGVVAGRGAYPTEGIPNGRIMRTAIRDRREAASWDGGGTRVGCRQPPRWGYESLSPRGGQGAGSEKFRDDGYVERRRTSRRTSSLVARASLPSFHRAGRTRDRSDPPARVRRPPAIPRKSPRASCRRPVTRPRYIPLEWKGMAQRPSASRTIAPPFATGLRQRLVMTCAARVLGGEPLVLHQRDDFVGHGQSDEILTVPGARDGADAILGIGAGPDDRGIAGAAGPLVRRPAGRGAGGEVAGTIQGHRRRPSRSGARDRPAPLLFPALAWRASQRSSVQ
jgi:hypothetical protein